MWVKLRTTPEQRAAWYAKAEAKGVNFSELARQALDGITVRSYAALIPPCFGSWHGLAITSTNWLGGPTVTSAKQILLPSRPSS